MTNYNVELRLAEKRGNNRYRNDDAFLTAPDSKRSIGRNFYFKFTGGSDLQGNPVDPPNGSGYVTGRKNVVKDIITIRFYRFSGPHWKFVGIEFTTIDGKPLDTTAHPITAVVTDSQSRSPIKMGMWVSNFVIQSVSREPLLRTVI